MSTFFVNIGSHKFVPHLDIQHRSACKFYEWMSQTSHNMVDGWGKILFRRGWRTNPSMTYSGNLLTRRFTPTDQVFHFLILDIVQTADSLGVCNKFSLVPLFFQISTLNNLNMSSFVGKTIISDCSGVEVDEYLKARLMCVQERDGVTNQLESKHNLNCI